MSTRVIQGIIIADLLNSMADKTTVGNDYVTVGDWDTSLLKTKGFNFSCTDNNLDVKILGSMDGGTTFPFEVEAEFHLVVGTAQAKRVIDYYTNLRVQVKPTVAGVHGTLVTDYSGISL